jgi:hypothetical protein
MHSQKYHWQEIAQGNPAADPGKILSAWYMAVPQMNAMVMIIHICYLP